MTRQGKTGSEHALPNVDHLRSQLPQTALVRLCREIVIKETSFRKNLKDGHRDLLFEAVSPCIVRSRDFETRQESHVEGIRELALSLAPSAAMGLRARPASQNKMKEPETQANRLLDGVNPQTV